MSHFSRSSVLVWILVVATIAFAACTGGDSSSADDENDCTEGQFESCSCSGLEDGQRTCRANGTWGDCECGGETGPDANPPGDDSGMRDAQSPAADASEIDPDTDEPTDTDAGTDADSGPPENFGIPEPVIGSDILERTYDPSSIRNRADRRLEPPSCDSNDPEVAILEEGDDLGSALQRSDKRIFCLRPGDYRSQSVTIDGVSGTDDAARWVRYYDPDVDDDLHPWHMADPETVGATERVLLGNLDLQGASHWVFDRLRFHGNVRVLDDSDSNVFHRVMSYRIPHEETFGNVITRFENADRNTIQHSVLARPEGDFEADSAPDTIGVMVKDAHDTRIVGNEMFDFYSGDAIQSGQNEANARGLIIQNNDIYRSASFDGPMENGIDLKAGPADTETGSVENISEEDYAIIEHNRLWGRGMNIIFHWPSVSGIIVRDNVLWETGGFAYAVPPKEQINNDHHVYDNLVVDTGGGFKVRHTDDSWYARNIFVSADGDDPTWSMFSAENNVITQNVFIDSDVGGSTDGHRVEDNGYYGSSTFSGAEPAFERADPADANHADRTVDIKRITEPNATKTLGSGRVEEGSPHAAWFDASAD